jgi:hypothetical protein
MVNTNKIVFALPEPDSAEYFARLFASVINLAEWKPGTDRPVAVGHDKVVLRSSSRAHHHAEADASSVSDIRSFSSVFASMSADMASWGTGSSSGRSDAAHGDVGILGPSPVSTLTHGDSFGRSAMASRGSSTARSSAQQVLRGSARSSSHAEISGQSSAHGESEAYITRYAWLPSQTYSLPEQIHRLASLLMNLPRRVCLVQLEAQPPYLSRTADLAPAFTNSEFKRVMLPRFFELAARTSPYVRPVADIDAELAERHKTLTQPRPDDDYDFAAPEPAPYIGDPEQYAGQFWQRRNGPAPAGDDEKPAPGRPPVGDLDEKHDRFRVVDGGKQDEDVHS